MYVTVDDESDKGIAPVVRIKSVGALHPSFFFILLSLYSATLYFTIANSSGLRSERRNKLSRYFESNSGLYTKETYWNFHAWKEQQTPTGSLYTGTRRPESVSKCSRTKMEHRIIEDPLNQKGKFTLAPSHSQPHRIDRTAQSNQRERGQHLKNQQRKSFLQP